jgi:hypothetical protein
LYPLRDVFLNTDLRITDIASLCGIEIGGDIPERLWRMGYTYTMHIGGVPAEKCLLTVCRSLFPRMEWHAYVESAYVLCDEWVFKTLEVEFTDSATQLTYVEQRWFGAVDLRLLGVRHCSDLLFYAKKWAQFCAITVNAKLTDVDWCETWALNAYWLLFFIEDADANRPNQAVMNAILYWYSQARRVNFERDIDSAIRSKVAGIPDGYAVQPPTPTVVQQADLCIGRLRKRLTDDLKWTDARIREMAPLCRDLRPATNPQRNL